ncbi:MAG: hypothetical protein AAF297_03690 [Planctomycetota bacterium]
MTLGDRWRLLDRAQHTRLFKIVASCVVGAIALIGYGVFFVAVTSGQSDPERILTARLGLDPNAAEVENDPRLQLLSGIVSGASDITAVGVAAAVSTVVALVVIWLGLGVTYFGLLLAAALIATPLWMFEQTEVYGRLLIGLVALTASFTALTQGLRTLLGGPGAVFAVARNVLAEAVRMKVSLVFIVLLIVGLAALPGLLDADQPLRYRVQSFLQWGTGFSYWVLGILVVLFGSATVAFEQRDKIVWQTMTKPVSSWQFVFGKWLGVAGLAAVLLAVCASGIFLFTEYMRQQPAVGEREAYVARDGDITEDRLILETQVLTARSGAKLNIPDELKPDGEAVIEAVQTRVDRGRRTNPNFANTRNEMARIASEVHGEIITAYRSLDPGVDRRYEFHNLDAARDRNAPITFRYRIDAEGNRPDRIYTMSFVMADGRVIVRESGLGFIHNVTLPPQYIDPNGVLTVDIINGELRQLPNGSVMIEPNPFTVTMPEEGLDVTYSVGSFHANYLRAVFVLWAKLAFIAMVAVWAATFLSFPVAAMVTGGVFIMAEGAGWLSNAADQYGYTDTLGNFEAHRALTTSVSIAVATVFGPYTELRPINHIVDGVRLPLGRMALGLLVLFALVGAFYAMASIIFRKRELATYSGQ